MGWSIQGGLHTAYSSDFMQRNRGEIHYMFHDNLLPNLIKDLDALCLSEPASPPRPRGKLDQEQLIEQFKEMRVEGRKTLFSTLVDCAKGFLTAEDRDRIANLIRPDPQTCIRSCPKYQTDRIQLLSVLCVECML